VIDLAPKLPEPVAAQDYFQSLSDFICKYFHDQLVSNLEKMQLALDLQPDDWFPFGFQFVGFAVGKNGEPVSRTHLIAIGKRLRSSLTMKSDAQFQVIPRWCKCSGMHHRIS
jgi:hypothetical protein